MERCGKGRVSMGRRRRRMRERICDGLLSLSSGVEGDREWEWKED